MESGNIYFRGFLFNQNVNDIEEAYELAESMLSNEIDISEKNKITFIENYKNIYFKTLSVSTNADTIYQNIKYDSDNKPHKNIFVFHFFDCVLEDNQHIQMYKYISNIENMMRLLIAFAYYLAPNLPYPKLEEYLIQDDINKYSKFFNFKETTYTYDSFIEGNNTKSISDNFNKFLDKNINEYNKIKNIIDIINETSLENKFLHKLRGAIAHNSMTIGYNSNSKETIDYNDIEKLETIYKKLNDIFDSTLKEH